MAMEKAHLEHSVISGGRYQEASEMINFLKNPPIQSFNNAPANNEEADGDRGRRTVTFEAALGNYCQLYLIAVDSESLVQRNIDLDSATGITKRDLRLNKVLDDKKGITETRKTVKLVPENIHHQQYPHSDFIEDITSSEVQLVDSIGKVVEILEEI